ncbi:MAG: hypothetical protein U0230_20120 [Polyangiales bacterium]
MLLQERALDPEVLETSRGTIRLWALGPTIYVIAMRGSMERPHSDLVMRYGERRWQAAGGRKLHMFHDWLEMGGYESQCRRDLTDWLLHRRDRYAEVHLAVRSKLVAMGVNAANVVLGGALRIHTDRDSLERALLKAVASEPRTETD